MFSRIALTREPLSRIAKASGKTALRAAAPSVSNRVLTPIALNVRWLSSKAISKDKKPMSLSQVLAAEISEEANNEVEETKSEDAIAVLKNFKMTETPGNGLVT